MNIHGHKETCKVLLLQEKFWDRCKKAASSRYPTAERICENHAAGERAKIRWHKKEIRLLQGRVKA